MHTEHMKAWVAALLLVAASACSGDSGSGGAEAGDAGATDTLTEDSGGADAAADTLAEDTALTDSGGDDSGGDDTGEGDTNEGDVAIDAPPEIAWCEGAESQIYEVEDLDLWPDGLFEVEDPESPTGIRLEVSERGFAQAVAEPLQSVVGAAEVATGFAANGALFFRFTGAIANLPESAEASLESDALIVLDLDAEPVRRLPFEVLTVEEEGTVMLKPVRPLELGHAHAAFVTTAARPESDEGGCFAPAETTRAILSGAAEGELARMTPRWLSALEAAGLEPARISAMTTFRVRDDRAVFQEIAETIRDTTYSWTVREPCEERERWRRCELYYDPFDFRDGEYVATPAAQGRNQVPVSVWLPLDHDGPVLPIVMGHGANTGRSLGRDVADLLVPEGFAVIAADAVEHGEHPIKGEGEGVDFLRFLGADISTDLELNAYQIRGNFNQAMQKPFAIVDLSLSNVMKRRGQ